MRRLTRFSLALAAVAALSGCAESSTAPLSADRAASPLLDAGAGRVVHRVTAGGTDFSAGYDANWSLVALEHADGSVTGQWTDQFGHGNGGLHIEIDCVQVAGRDAWVSGTVKSGVLPPGTRFNARMRDNGTSANEPPDEVSVSYYGGTSTCRDMRAYPLIVQPNGQVKVD